MASTTQQVDHTKRRNMNYVSQIEKQDAMFLSSKNLSNSIYVSSM